LGRPAPETPVLRERLREIAEAGLPRELADLWKGLAGLQSLHLQAQVESWVSSKVSESHRDLWGAAAFELWEAGDRYRISAPVPGALGLSQISEIAFDGSRYQMFLRDSSLVTVSSTDSRIYPLPLRNPLALVAHFANPYDDATCGLCELRLADLRVLAPAVRSSQQSSVGTLLKTPEARFGQQVATGYRLQFRPARRGVVSTLEQVTAQGQVLTRVRLENFNAVPGHPDLIFPWTIVYEILDDRGRRPVIRHSYQIELIEVDRDFPESMFRLTTLGGRHVWDDDNRVHVQ
jgi:hypothetical protein